MEIILFIIAVIVFFAIILKANSPKNKGKVGEYHVKKILSRLHKTEYKVYNDIYLKLNGKSTQIDHLIVSVYGVFVIETKNYKGWIHGREHSNLWKQTFYKKKQTFGNPIIQNNAHIHFLKKVLSNIPEIQYHSIVVFTGTAVLKNVYTATPVIYKKHLLKTIHQYNRPILSNVQFENISNQLSKFCTDTKKAKKEHEAYVIKASHEREKNIKALICPNCKNDLILKKSKYGNFYGCSNFPKCRFLQNIN